MQLIIDIPKDYYELIKYDVDNHLTDYMPFVTIANGTPLEDVKKKISKKSVWIDGFNYVAPHKIDEIFYEIESEVSE